jgi:anti-sigma factor RsiW
MSADVEHVTCQEFVEVLTDYLDGALEPAERADVERHIVICRGCSNYIEQMRSTIDLLGRIGEQDGPDRDGEANEQLLSLFRQWRAGRSPA